jgi:cell division protein FtsB
VTIETAAIGAAVAVLTQFGAAVWVVSRLRGEVDGLNKQVGNGLAKQVTQIVTDTAALRAEMGTLKGETALAFGKLDTLSAQVSALEATCRERGRRGECG